VDGRPDRRNKVAFSSLVVLDGDLKYGNSEPFGSKWYSRGQGKKKEKGATASGNFCSSLLNNSVNIPR